jgi:hypothetical protein
MPLRKAFRGRKVKNTRQIVRCGKILIRITFYGRKGKPGHQIDVTPEEYQKGVTRRFEPSRGT